ncbi:MAG TPA: alpha/beta hydrolase domain-containing protein [Streptosporangiaceae bacterium]
MTHRVRNVSSILGGALAGTLVASMLTLAPSAAAAPLAGRSASSGPLPTLTQVPPGSGSHGYPYDAVPTTPTFPGAPTINLSSYGYAESEFTMSGTTSIYRQSGFWSSNGRWGVSVAQSSVPYTTRLLVRYPTDPSKFNGTVVVEWLNDTTGGDQDPVWSEIYNEALSQGYAYIGVTAQTAGMVELKTWDSQRYGALGDSNDGQSYDIFSQAAEVARADSATVLGGLSPARVIGAGDSQSAFRVDTYVNAIQPVSHAFDGFLAIGRSVFTAPIGSGLIAFLPAPAYVRTDNTTPFIQLNTEGDIEELGAALVRQPDNNFLRTWELPGAAHIDLHEGIYEGATIQREQPQVTAPQCVSGVPFNGATLPDNQPVYELEDAALAALDKWLVYGVQPAHGNPIATTPLLNLVERDRYGNALGGIRMPDIQAPAETYTAINFYLPSQASLSPGQLLSTLVSIFTALQTGAITNTTLRNEGLCLLEGYYTPLGSTTLKALYPTHSDYVSAFTSAAARDLAGGFLTQSDYNAAVAAAEASPVP